MVDEYIILRPPMSLDLENKSKRELREYCQWYIDQIPVRLKILIKAVTNTKGFENWQPDFSPDSLNMLGEWFALQVETRELAVEEIKNIYDNGPEWFKTVEIESWELTNRTLSIAIDVGMYIGRVFLNNNEILEWKFLTNVSKSHDGYGQPVIVPFGKNYFNPTGMMYTYAYGLARKNRTGSGLRELYDIWIAMI